MALAKFVVGQGVSMVHPQRFWAEGTYKIVGEVPNSEGPIQYRVRHESEPYERIIEESRLEAVHNG